MDELNLFLRTIKSANLKTFGCPVCKLFLRPPIITCGAGHNYCATCSLNIKECVICKNPKVTSRNLGLEELLDKLKFECQYAPNGCNATMKGAAMNQHIAKCDYKIYEYPLEEKLCLWHGPSHSLRWQYLFQHQQVSKGTLINQLMRPLVLLIFKVCNKMFLVQRQYNNGFVKWFIYHFGTYERSKQFSYTVKMSRSMVLKAACMPIHLYRSPPHDRAVGVEVPIAYVNHLFHNGMLMNQINIKKRRARRDGMVCSRYHRVWN